jgi:hypothetical protein
MYSTFPREVHIFLPRFCSWDTWDNKVLILTWISGRKLKANPLKLEAAKVPADIASGGVYESNEKKGISNGENSGDSDRGSKDAWSHGVTESEWEMAQRATRTATWGEWKACCTRGIL